MMRQPTSDECDSHAMITEAGEQWMAAWYPQMGGYGAYCWVNIRNEHDGVLPCFDVLVWHDGEFPFGDGNPPTELHHCVAAQFIEFGSLVKRMQEGK